MSALYLSLRAIARMGLRFYYSGIDIYGLDNLPSKGPVILAANHPNAMMDPILMAAVAPQKIGFLAKKALFFNPPATRFLDALGAIPVARREDLKPGDVFDNRQSFEKACEFLKSEGTLLVFPEGVSKIERNLRKIKTGSARIAFQLEEATQFTSGLQVVTVALHYSDPTRFRSRVTVVFDRPIPVDYYKAMHESNPETAVQSLTKRIERRLFNKTVISEEEETLELVAGLYVQHLKTNFAHRDDPKTALFLAKSIGKAISRYKLTQAGKYSELYQEIKAYRDALNGHLLEVKAYHETMTHPYNPGTFLYRLLLRLLFFPFYLTGAIINSIPYLVAGKVTPLISREEEFKAGLQLALGVIAFPMWYLILAFCVSYLLGFGLQVAFLFTVGFALLSLFSIRIHPMMVQYFNEMRVLIFRIFKPGAFATLEERRRHLMREMDLVREDVFKSNPSRVHP